jgi:benzoylformate decarboxylase
VEKTPGVPGLNLPGLDITATAASYGVSTYEAGSTDDVAKLVREGIAERANPTLINVPVTRVHLP